MTKTYTQAELDAAVAAALEKAAEVVEKNDDGVASWHIDTLADEIRALIPTDALAEHDAKVRADALREIAEFVHSYTAAQHVASDIKAGAFPEQTPICEAIARDIQALIEGEA